MAIQNVLDNPSKPAEREVSRWVTRSAVFCAVLIGLGMFAISFTALRDLAIRSGISPALGWVWAVCIDGIIAASTLALVALAKHPTRAKALPWILIVTGGAVSVAGNIFDAQIHAEPGFAAIMVVVIAAAPPLGLLSLTQLVVILSRRTAGSATDSQQQVAVPSPVIESYLPVQVPSIPLDPNPVKDPTTKEPPSPDEVFANPSAERLSPAAGGYEEAKEWALKQLVRGNDPTGTDVAERFGCSTSTARRWLRKIREEHQRLDERDAKSETGSHLRAVGS